MKKLFKLFEWIIFVVMLCAVVVIASPFLLIKQSLSSYAIASGSMEPTITIGTLTFVKQIPTDTLQKGDIIAFTDPTKKDRVILHRIYSVNQTRTTRTFQTKGDNNKASDAWTVLPTMVRGKLLFIIPYIGYLSELLKTPLGFGLMIGIPALLFIFLSSMRIREGIREEIEKGIVKREKSSGSTMHTLLIYAAPFFISALILATVPPIYGLNFGHVTVRHISVSMATPTPKPTGTPTPTAKLTPTPTPKNSGGGTTIIISGNGNGSNNSVTVNNNTNTTINQSNNTTTSTNVTVTNNTGNNTSSNNTNSTVNVTSGSISTHINVTNLSSSNSAKL